MRNRRPAATTRNTHARVMRPDRAHPRSRDDAHGAVIPSIVRDVQTHRRTENGTSANPSDDVFAEKRPWGRFEQLVSNTQVTVKIITVEPGQRLSLQRHSHRGELWQILDVPMEIVVDEHHWTTRPGDCVWVPRGAAHRLANPGPHRGRVLEVAFGRFDEDDIERLADDYAR